MQYLMDSGDSGAPAEVQHGPIAPLRLRGRERYLYVTDYFTSGAGAAQLTAIPRTASPVLGLARSSHASPPHVPSRPHGGHHIYFTTPRDHA